MIGAIGRLFSQYRTECCFGWHDKDPVWRAKLRDLYPVHYVAAHHRESVPLDMIDEHMRRVVAFNRNLFGPR